MVRFCNTIVSEVKDKVVPKFERHIEIRRESARHTIPINLKRLFNKLRPDFEIELELFDPLG